MVMQFGVELIKNKIRRNCLDRPWLADLIAGHCNRFNFFIVNQRVDFRKETNKKIANMPPRRYAGVLTSSHYVKHKKI